MTLHAMLASWRARTAPAAQALWALGALAVLAALAWALVLDPLARDLAATQTALDDARTKLARARMHREDLAGLAKAPAHTTAADLRGIVERGIAQAGLRPAVTALQVREQRVDVTFEAIDFAALTALLDTLGREAGVHPVEVLLAARTSPGSVRAEVVLAP